jgi:hypothetical protein
MFEFPGITTRAYNPWCVADSREGRDVRSLAIILFEILAGWQPFATLPGVGRWLAIRGESPELELRACLDTARCARSAADPFFQQLLAWMTPMFWAVQESGTAGVAWMERGEHGLRTEPPRHAAVAAFLRRRAEPTYAALLRLLQQYPHGPGAQVRA